MSTPAYRIEYSLQRADSWDGEFVEVGFGSSAACDSPDDAAYVIGAQVTHNEWETHPGMPDPDALTGGDQ